MKLAISFVVFISLIAVATESPAQGKLSSITRFSLPIKTCSAVFSYKGEVYFCGYHPRLGRELFRTNGTPEGTHVVDDIDIGPGSSDPNSFFVLRDKLYFFAETTLLGRELWRTDGTSEGTKRIKDITPGPASSNVSTAGFGILLGTRAAYLPVNGDYWRTDGTSDGTIKLESVDNIIGTYKGALYYGLDSTGYNTGPRLMRLKEGETNSEMVADFSNDCYGIGTTGYGEDIESRVFGGRLHFDLSCSPNDDVPSGYVLMSTDGTSAGTSPIIDGLTARMGDLNGLNYWFNLSKDRFFSSDGLSAEIIDICNPPQRCEGATSSGLPQIGGRIGEVVRNRILISVERDNKSSLWSLGATPADFVKLHDGEPFSIRAANPQLAFFHTLNKLKSGAHRINELWSTRGTPATTRLLRNFGEAEISASIVVNRRYLFTVSTVRTNQDRQVDLWESDGTPNGTRLLRRNLGRVGPFRYEIYVLGNRAYFNIDQRLWQSDGTKQGTYPVVYSEEVEVESTEKGFIPPLLQYLLEEDVKAVID